MNMNKRKVYVVPEVRIVEVCQENLMNNPTSWDDGWGNKNTIIEGTPDEGSDPYAPNGMVLMRGMMILSIDNV